MTEPGIFSDIFDNTPVLNQPARAMELTVPIGFLHDLSEATSRAEILSIYSVWSQRVIDAERCSIALDEKDGMLHVTTMNGTKGIEQGAQFDILSTVAGAVFQRRKGVLVTDLGQIGSPGLKQLANMGYKSALIAPLVTGSHCFGVINASFKTIPDYPALMLAKLETIGRCLATQLLVIEQMGALATKAETDPLTGAQNRYALYDQAAKAWADWQDNNVPFSFVCADVDFFKQINDTYGHDIGDSVLCAFVKRIQGRGRVDDSCVRLGGEEFGMLMTNTSLDIAIARAQRLCDAIGNTPFSVADAHLNVTASFGVASVVADDMNFDDVLKRADIALYEAKAGGRDQVVSLSAADLAA